MLYILSSTANTMDLNAGDQQDKDRADWPTDRSSQTSPVRSTSDPTSNLDEDDHHDVGRLREDILLPWMGGYNRLRYSDEVDRMRKSSVPRLATGSRSSRMDRGSARKASAEQNDASTALAKIRLQIAELKVKHRLFPAMTLLAHATESALDELRSAEGYAREALRLARDLNLGEAAEGRCSYYIGVACYRLAQSAEESASPGIPGSLADDRIHKSGCANHFRRACAAKDVYDEGTWAAQWVEFLSASTSSGVTGARPIAGQIIPDFSPLSSADSFQESLTSSTEQSFVSKMNDPLQTTDSLIQQHINFDSETEDDIPNSVMGGNIKIENFRSPKPSPRLGGPDMSELFTDSGIVCPTFPAASPHSSLYPREGTSSGSLLIISECPPPPGPTHGSHRERLDAAITPIYAAETAAAGKRTSQPISERRRKSSLQWLVSKERRPSELEQAEEGQSPYRASFAATPEFSEGPEGSTLRRGSRVEDIV